MFTLAIIGTGYVGLVSGVCFAEHGNRVICVDSDAAKIDSLKQGIPPIYEQGLKELLEKNAQAGRLSFTTDIHAATNADMIFIAVGTPQGEHGLPDMKAVDGAVAQLAEYLDDHTLVVMKSTVPIGTTRKMKDIFARKGIRVAFNPEFLREGSAVKDFMHPDRVVIGVDSREAREALETLYAPICGEGAQVFATTFESAEMIKYASNGFLATKIAFINEMSDICEKVGANVRDVAAGMGMDKRIGPLFLNAGPGYGGACFPKDTSALALLGEAAGAPSRIIQAVMESNEARKTRMAEKIFSALGHKAAGKTVAVLGLTFKANTDDMRESVALRIIPQLQRAGMQVRAYDPQGMREARTLLGEDIAWCESALEALRNADAAVILTEWAEFRKIDWKEGKHCMSGRLVIDLRNLYRRRAMMEAGMRYVSVGRQTADAQGELTDLLPVQESAA